MESDKNSAADQTVYSDRLPLEMQTNPGCGMHQTGHWQMWMQNGNYLNRHSARDNYIRSPSVIHMPMDHLIFSGTKHLHVLLLETSLYFS